jgi:hypothetical protein
MFEYIRMGGCVPGRKGVEFREQLTASLQGWHPTYSQLGCGVEQVGIHLLANTVPHTPIIGPGLDSWPKLGKLDSFSEFRILFWREKIGRGEVSHINCGVLQKMSINFSS